MEIKTRWAQDKNGKVIPFATVSLFYEGTTDLVTGLEDKDGGPLSNPFQSDVNGKAVFAAPDGQYDIKFSSGPRESTASIQFLDVSGAIQAVENMDALRSIAGNSGRDYILAKFHTSDGDGGGGNFYWESGAAPGTYVDNNGTIIVPTGGDGSAAWVREYSGAASPKWFGAKGDGVSDDTDILKTALSVCGKVSCPPGTYMIRGSTNGRGVLMPSNSHLIFEPGAVFKVIPTSASNYSIIEVRETENVIIDNPVVIGDRYEHIGVSGETGMGIRLLSCKNVTINNARASQCWGDGVYVGRLDISSYCENITINTLVCDDNRRQGVSIISVKGLRGTNWTLKNTNGTAPQAGIDFEPNNADEVLQDIEIDGLITANNAGSGILALLYNLGATDPLSVKITNWTDTESSLPLNIRGVSSSSDSAKLECPGQFIVDNAVSIRGVNGGFTAINWLSSGPDLVMENIKAIDPNTSNSMGAAAFSGLSVLKDSGESLNLGNIHVRGYSMVKTGDVASYATSPMSMPDRLRGCSFIDVPVESVGLGALRGDLGSVIYNPEYKPTDAGTWTGDTVKTYAPTTSLVTDFTNILSEDSFIQLPLAEGYIRPWTFRSQGGGLDTGLMAPPGKIFHPASVYGSNILELKGAKNVLGASLETQCINGEWHVVNAVGEWAPFDFNPMTIPGVLYYYTPWDLNTLFQDAAGVTPVTSPGQFVGRQLDVSGNGNHRIQSLTNPKPTYGIEPFGGKRNLFLNTEAFDAASWTKTNASVTANSAAAPNGSMTADLIVPNSVNTTHGAQLTYTGSGTLALSVYAKAGGYNFLRLNVGASGNLFRAYFDLSTGEITLREGGMSGNILAASMEDAGGGWWRCAIVGNGVTNPQVSFYPAEVSGSVNFAGDESSGVYLWGADLEAGALTHYQRVGANQFDCTEDGIETVHYVRFDGINDAMATSSVVTLSGGDEINLFAGLVMDSAAAEAVLIELGSSIASNNGSFLVTAPSSGLAGVGFNLRGDSLAAGIEASASAGTRMVLSAGGKISTPERSLQVSNNTASSSSASIGAGNLGDYSLYFGARNSSSMYFRGKDYGHLCVAGPVTDEQKQQIKRFLARKAGVVLP